MSFKRMKYVLSDQWRFFRGGCEGAENKNYLDNNWEGVSVPHTVREEAADCSGGKNYLGECWYRRKIQINLSDDQRAVLKIGGAKHISRVFIDGNMICEHIGGYLPFLCDVTAYLTDGEEHSLAIWMDNSDSPDIPPGKPQGDLDFCYFGGLYREVNLVVTNLLHISDALEEDDVAGGGIFVKYSNVTKETATVNARIHVRNNSSEYRSSNIITELVTNAGEIVATNTSDIKLIKPNDSYYEEATFEITQPKLWHPDNPYLYSLRVKVCEEDNVVDEVIQKIGIRSINFTDKGFFINGKQLPLVGANRHQEYVHIGDALPDCLHKEDARLLKKYGFNIIRTGHYPQNEAFMDACDELGLLCIVPTPGWQWFRDNDVFLNRVYSDIRKLIRWHRNRPSVVLWEPILNETSYSEAFAKNALAITHEEYSGNQCFAAADAGHPWTENYEVSYPKPAKEGQASFVREFGDLWLEQYGRKGTNFRCSRGQQGFYSGGEKAMIASALERAKVLRDIVNNPNLSGGALWAGIDTNRGYIDNIAAVGALDLYRLPKFSAEFFRSQKGIWSNNAEPMVSIATWWQSEGDKTRDIYIFTNCNEVKLTLNNKEILGGKKVENLEDLPYPPIIYYDVPFEAGRLCAEGINNGQACCNHVVNTPKEAVSLKVRLEERQEKWVADGTDIAIVRIELVDEFGTIVPKDGIKLDVDVTGEGKQVGRNCPWTNVDNITTEAGIATILVRSTNTSGSMEITVKANGLAGSSLTLVSEESQNLLLPTEKLIPPSVNPVYSADNQELFSPGSGTEMAKDQARNITLHRPATASSQCEDFPAEFALNTDPFLFWKAEEGVKKAILDVDLQGKYIIEGYRILWGSDRHHYTCKMMGSQDGKEYVELDSVHTFSGQDVAERVPKAIPIRFVRLEILDATGQIAIYSFIANGEFVSN